MEQKIIFLDIDGTLTEPGSNEPPESAICAIRQARDKGHYVFLCTGRNYNMLLPVLKYGFDGVIASSGGYIKCREEVIYDCPMTESQRQSAMDILKANGIFRTVECMVTSITCNCGGGFLLTYEYKRDKIVRSTPIEFSMFTEDGNPEALDRSLNKKLKRLWNKAGNHLIFKSIHE